MSTSAPAVWSPPTPTEAASAWHPTMVGGRTERGSVPWRRVSLVLMALLVTSAAWMAWQVKSLADEYAGRVAPGISVAGLDLAGMTFDEATTALQSHVAARLDRSIEVVVGTASRTVTPRELGATSNVDNVLQDIVAASEDLTFQDWAGIRWLGQGVREAQDLQLGAVPDGAGDAIVAELAAQVTTPVVQGGMTYDEHSITFTQGSDGFRVNVAGGQTQLAEALQVDGDGPERVVVPGTVVHPTTTLEALGQVIYLNKSEHHLQVWRNGQLQAEFDVATGSPGYPTPEGEYWVEEKRENPTWTNPAPNGWGADMPAFIGPGPSNPLGVRAINWGGTDAIRFHGTNKIWSIGTDASHGCVRLTNEDVVALFDIVELNAKIISVA